MGTARWSIIVSEETDRALRAYLSESGHNENGDISNFVADAVQLRLFELTAEQIKGRNRNLDQSDILSAINEAMGNR